MKCRDNGTCIHSDMICNEISDCMDGSDEENCGKLYTFSYNVKSEMCKMEVICTFEHNTCINQKQQQKIKCMKANVRIIRIFKFRMASMLECIKSMEYTTHIN